MTARPGLAKAGRPPLVQTRVLQLWRGQDSGWREAFESADVMSEGAIREEDDGPVYYGTTSVVLPLASHQGTIPDSLAQQALQLLAGDPHARLRAIRIARLEAHWRAGGPLATARTEVRVRPHAKGICLDVEIEARLITAVGTKPDTSPGSPAGGGALHGSHPK